MRGTQRAIDPPGAGARYLTLDGVRTDVESGYSYTVYLGRVDREHMVGFLRFYDAHRALNREFNAEAAIARVRAAGEPWVVYFVPTPDATFAAGSNPRIERIGFRSE